MTKELPPHPPSVLMKCPVSFQDSNGNWRCTQKKTKCIHHIRPHPITIGCATACDAVEHSVCTKYIPLEQEIRKILK